MNSFLQTLKLLGPLRLAALGGVGLATLLGLFLMMMQLGSASMTTIYRGLSPDEGGAIVQRLEQLNIPYQASSDGTRISVPDEQAGRVRMLLAEEGLPSGGGVGYEIFNQPEGFGTSSFLQNINQQRALEGELARTIRGMSGIAGARVQLVLPKRELFSRDAAQARASVFLELRGGDMDRQQISAIQHLVSSAVPQLEPGKVAIIDSRGNLLASGTGSNTLSAQQASAEEQRIAVEQRLSQRVEEILGRTVGFEKVRAEVTVDIDLDSITTQSETFDPETQVARSTQSVTEQSQTNEPTPPADASVSVVNNLPGGATGAQSATTSASTPTSKNSRTEETSNFEISKTTQNHVRNPGSLRRLSVAVLVDGTYTTEGEGKDATQVYKPRSQAELDQYAALVRSAVGFDANRGDTVEVANLQFVQEDDGSKADMLTKLTGNPQLMRMAEVGLFGLLGIMVLLLFVRPLVKSLMEPRQLTEDKLLASTAAAAQLSGPGALAEQMDMEEGEQQPDSMIDINRVDGRVKASSLKKMGEIIDKHPEEAVAIVRQWIYAES
jgi:flagellar M-ring protein FliF